MCISSTTRTFSTVARKRSSSACTSTEERAADRVERSRTLPGFVDHPNDFTIDRYELDKDEWTEGFVRA
jgi:hypothetical protein